VVNASETPATDKIEDRQDGGDKIQAVEPTPAKAEE